MALEGFDHSVAARAIAAMSACSGLKFTGILNCLHPDKLAYIFEKGSSCFKPACASVRRQRFHHSTVNIPAA
jgi:hypothetical protein